MFSFGRNRLIFGEFSQFVLTGTELTSHDHEEKKQEAANNANTIAHILGQGIQKAQNTLMFIGFKLSSTLEQDSLHTLYEALHER